MKAPRKSVAWLLPLLLTGCVHKTQRAQNQQLAPPIVDTPMPTPPPAPQNLPGEAPSQAPPQQATAQIPAAHPEDKPVRHRTHHKPDSKTTEQASVANDNSAVPAIGQLTSGDPSSLRSQTEDSIQSTERTLKDMSGRSLNDQQQKTVAQIREFLKQARSALVSSDVDGAHTLALKAQVLLGEISH